MGVLHPCFRRRARGSRRPRRAKGVRRRAGCVLDGTGSMLLSAQASRQIGDCLVPKSQAAAVVQLGTRPCDLCGAVVRHSRAPAGHTTGGELPACFATMKPPSFIIRITLQGDRCEIVMLENGDCLKLVGTLR